MHVQRMQTRQGPSNVGTPRAPVWVLVLGAVLLGLALVLTVIGPRQFEPVSTRSVGVSPVASGN